MAQVSDTAEDGPVTVDADSRQRLLDALQDADCRAILRATSGAALSAYEVAETCGLPLSTTYRKLDLLTAAELLAERMRIRRSGKHASEYVRRVEDVHVSVSASGELDLKLSLRNDGPPMDHRMWSE